MNGSCGRRAAIAGMKFNDFDINILSTFYDKLSQAHPSRAVALGVLLVHCVSFE